MTEPTWSGIRIEADGTCTDFTAPTLANGLSDWLRNQYGAWYEFAHYGTAQHAVCLAVHETSADDGHPVNRLATDLVEQLRGAPLGYRLYGVVFVFGFVSGVMTDLQDETRTMLAAIAGGVR